MSSTASDKHEREGLYSSSDAESRAMRAKLAKEYSFTDYLKTWCNPKTLAEKEHDVLYSVSNIMNLNNPNIKVEVIDTEIDYQTEYQASLSKYRKEVNKIHEVSIDNQTNSSSGTKREVVMVHGYGASLGLFYNNFEALSTMENTNVHLLDLLGFGLSSRPKFPARKAKKATTFEYNHEKYVKNKETGELEPQMVTDGVSIKTSLEDVDIAESFFVDSLESWRRAKNIEKFVLIGHSLGGYLSSCYALKYPERVTKLVLLSPVGLETSSFDLTKNNNDKKSKIQISEEDMKAAPDAKQELPDDFVKNLSKIKNGASISSDHTGHAETPFNPPGILKWFWKSEVSPFTFVRKAYFFGPSVIRNWSFSRFMDLKDEKKILMMHEYIYSCFVAKGSGEYCIPRLLSTSILPYYPLLRRVPKGIQCDSLWVYGDHDWMNSSAGASMCNEINQLGKHKADFEIVSNGGHHMYLDNPKEFNKMLLNYIKK